MDVKASTSINCTDSSDVEDDSVFNKYSCTPPSRQAVKLLRKRKDFRVSRTVSYHRPATPDESPTDSDNTTGPRWKKERDRNLQRESERTIKWVSSDMLTTSAGCSGVSSGDEESSVERSGTRRMKVESRNRFMSLCSRLVKLPKKIHSRSRSSTGIGNLIAECKDRGRFHLSLTELMKTGNVGEAVGEKSEEELLWQNELKDILWLELQAWISGKSPQQFDEYLLAERHRIPDVLQKIMDYTYRRKNEDTETCKGCLSAFCDDCANDRKQALTEVSSLLDELEKVEELYPSCRSLRADHPQYGTSSLVDRVRALCLWFNVTRSLQLKIDIIGHMLLSLPSKGLPWPLQLSWPTVSANRERDNSNGTRTKVPEDSGGSNNTNSLSGSALKKKGVKRQTSRVQFVIEMDNDSRTEDSPTASWKSEYSGGDLPESDEGLKNFYVTEPYVPLESENQSMDSPSIASPSTETSMRCLVYRRYVEKALKTKGLKKMLRWFFMVHRLNMMRAKEALRKPEGESGGKGTSEEIGSTSWTTPFDDTPWEEQSINILGEQQPDESADELQRYGTWSQEFHSLNLPQYKSLYLFLCRIPLDVIREALSIRLAEKPSEPSELSIRQLMQEFKEGLRGGVLCLSKYRRDVQCVLNGLDCQTGNLDGDILDEKEFGTILTRTLDVYLDYLKRWVQMALPSAAVHKSLLEQEWSFVRSVCTYIPSGESSAGDAFCQIASSMLRFTGQSLHSGIKESLVCRGSCGESTDEWDGEEPTEKEAALVSLRRIQSTFRKARHNCLQSVAVARMIRKDLEVVYQFEADVPLMELLRRISNTDHIRLANQNDKCLIFVPSFLVDQKEHLLDLLNLRSLERVHCKLEGCTDEGQEPYVLLLPNSSTECIDELWRGLTASIEMEAIPVDAFYQGQGPLLIVGRASHLSSRRRYVQELLGPGLSIRHEQRPSNQLSTGALIQLKEQVLRLSQKITEAIEDVENKCDVHRISASLEHQEQLPLISRWNEVVRQCYKLGFEYHKDVLRLISSRPCIALATNVCTLARKWMAFAVKRCDRGRGLRPRWATHGLDFLLIACDPEVTQHLLDSQFMEMKQQIADCVGHIIGSAIPTVNHLSSQPNHGHFLMAPNTSKSRSPSPAVRRANKMSASASFGSSLSSGSLLSPNLTTSPVPVRRYSLMDEPTSLPAIPSNDISLQVRSGFGWKDRVRHAVETIDAQWDARLEKANLIGRVSQHRRETRSQIRLKNVTFSWQRGVKIGQGRFGRVFTAVNNRTGELMAMKEITLQPNDHRAIRSVADELRIFEGIHHEHLVRHYGLEIHREEMIIFMEFCPEGTLENLVSSTESGLPEELIRRFTRQLLEAVDVLHENGIVHRDIKSANIFLADKGNCLKLGDFGCAAKIRAHTTMAGELQGFVGTQAYMAPEVFMHTMGEGHGRAADIWSVGCVVVEMSTGKRPWHELESNYAIMFKVGMGEVPPTPSTLSQEGQQFLGRLLQHDPRSRDTALQLLDHHFLRIYTEEDAAAAIHSNYE